MKKVGIPYLNLTEPLYRELAHMNPRVLRANPADGHAGPVITDVFASEVFNYLKTHEILEKLAIKKAVDLYDPDGKHPYVSGTEILKTMPEAEKILSEFEAVRPNLISPCPPQTAD